jgi:hypothetical protein
MANGPLDPLTAFFDRRETSTWSVQVVNRTAAKPVQLMIEDLFDGLSVAVTEREFDDRDEDLLLLLHDGSVVEMSPLRTLLDTLLVVNSDLYRTGTVSLDEINPPDVITRLSDTVFTLNGYPEAATEKLVLTLISRYIEHRAWSHGAGTLRTSFQRLSLLDDEGGTRDVYERLGAIDGLDVHVYGIPDWDIPETLRVTPHGITDGKIERYWFVVYASEDGRSIAMLAEEIGPNEWRGFWTFDTDEIHRLDRCITRAI